MTIGDEPINADKVQQLQESLHAKADPQRVPESPSFRFYALYDKVYRLDVLRAAYRTIDLHTRQLFRKWLVAKHKKTGRGINQYPDTYLFEELGLLRLTSLRTRQLRGRIA